MATQLSGVDSGVHLDRAIAAVGFEARSQQQERKVDADRFAATVSVDLVRGQYVDPDTGKTLFETDARKWLAAQTFDEGTHVALEL